MAANNAQGSAHATIDHDEIREWVEQHGGHPAEVKKTRRGNTPGILRIDFPGFSGEGSLEEISWEDFFQRFDDSNLAFLYQDRTKSGRPSRFNKLVSRDTVEVRGGSKRQEKSRPSRVDQERARNQKVEAEPTQPSRNRRKTTARRNGRSPQAEIKASSGRKQREPASRKTSKRGSSSPSPAKKRTRRSASPSGARATSSRPSVKRGATSKKSSGTKRSSAGR